MVQNGLLNSSIFEKKRTHFYVSKIASWKPGTKGHKEADILFIFDRIFYLFGSPQFSPLFSLSMDFHDKIVSELIAEHNVRDNIVNDGKADKCEPIV